MYCPECRSEYREGFFECVDCEVPLVGSLPEQPPHPDLQLVTVFEGSNPSLLAMAESLLMAEEIPYLKKGEQIQDLFALGRLPSGFNPVIGPVLIQVPEEHAEAARELLADLEAMGLGPEAEEGPEPFEEPE